MASTDSNGDAAVDTDVETVTEPSPRRPRHPTIDSEALNPKLERITSMSVEGVSRSAIARVEHLSRPTVDRWLERASDAAQHFNDRLIRNVPLQELQADEIQTIALDQAHPTWIFTTLEVWSRLWVSTVIGRSQPPPC